MRGWRRIRSGEELREQVSEPANKRGGDRFLIRVQQIVLAIAWEVGKNPMYSAAVVFNAVRRAPMVAGDCWGQSQIKLKRRPMRLAIKPRGRGVSMAATSWQTWNSGPFSMERKPGKMPGTVILRFTGPFTTRDVYSSQEPLALKKMLELETLPGEEVVTRNILDLSACPFMDSSGLGMIVTHYVHCKKMGIRMIAAGISPRVMEVMRLTKVDTILPHCATVEEAENS